MSLDSSFRKPPPPLAPSWRMILWGMTLAPALLILSWSLRQARSPKPDVVSAGITTKDSQRLQRILKEPREASASRLQNDAVRVVESSADLSSADSSGATATGDAQLDKSILVGIKDNSFGIPAAEKPAYDAILAKVRHTSLVDLEANAQKDVPFAVLMLGADRFRGELLSIEGDVRRINRLSTLAAEPEDDHTFEAWMFTADSGLNPYRVVLASLPDGISTSDELKRPIRARVTGYFFKRYSYATANDFHTAPLLLAKTLTPLARSHPAASPRANNSRSLTIMAMGILATFLIGGLVIELAIRRRNRRTHATPDSPPDLSWLNRE